MQAPEPMASWFTRLHGTAIPRLHFDFRNTSALQTVMHTVSTFHSAACVCARFARSVRHQQGKLACSQQARGISQRDLASDLCTCAVDANVAEFSC